MLGIFQDGTEVIVCEVDNDGQLIVGAYFEEGNGRPRDDMDFSLVEGPIRIERGSMKAEPERTLTG